MVGRGKPAAGFCISVHLSVETKLGTDYACDGKHQREPAAEYEVDTDHKHSDGDISGIPALMSETAATEPAAQTQLAKMFDHRLSKQLVWQVLVVGPIVSDLVIFQPTCADWLHANVGVVRLGLAVAAAARPDRSVDRGGVGYDVGLLRLPVPALNHPVQPAGAHIVIAVLLTRLKTGSPTQ